MIGGAVMTSLMLPLGLLAPIREAAENVELDFGRLYNLTRFPPEASPGADSSATCALWLNSNRSKPSTCGCTGILYLFRPPGATRAAGRRRGLARVSAIGQNGPAIIEIKGLKTSHFKESKTAPLGRAQGWSSLLPNISVSRGTSNCPRPRKPG
jgi:hypothetical protein